VFTLSLSLSLLMGLNLQKNVMVMSLCILINGSIVLVNYKTRMLNSFYY